MNGSLEWQAWDIAVRTPTGSNDQVRTSRADDRAASAASLTVDREIDRYDAMWPPSRRSLSLHFTKELEPRFEADTRMVRVRELRFTMALAIGFYYLTLATDSVFVPDIGLAGLVYRILALPLMLPIFIWPLAGIVRETIVMLAGFVSLIFLVVIPSTSAAPFALFAYGTAVLAIIYINTTFPLRFYHACVFTALSCGLTIAQIFIRDGMDFGLQWTMSLQIAIAGSFSLIANYRIERNVRLTYLLALREALRLEALAADREAFEKLSNIDALTGIANRGHFNRQSATVLADPARIGVGIALLMLDVDHFKRYNDHYGHAAGDVCLRAVASAIADGFRDRTDLVARYGGEEFVIMLLDVTPGQARTIATRLCETIAALRLEHLNRNDGMTIVTLSVGGAMMTAADEPMSMEALIDVADKALYAAKRGGRNRFESSMQLAA